MSSSLPSVTTYGRKQLESLNMVLKLDYCFCNLIMLICAKRSVSFVKWRQREVLKVSTHGKVGPLKVLQTKGCGGMLPQTFFQILGLRSAINFLRFPRDIFSIYK